MVPFPDVNEFTEDVRRVFDELDRRHGRPCHGLSSLHAPALDVWETEAAVEIHVDLPGVPPDAIHVLFKDGALVILGDKLATEPCGPGGSAFHLLERGFGRFARVVRLTTAVDASGASAVLDAGELRIRVPRIAERRGRDIVIPVRESAAASRT